MLTQEENEILTRVGPGTPCGELMRRYWRYVEMAQGLRFLVREGAQTLTQAAIRFILMHAGVTVVLSGFSAMSHLEELVPISGAGPLAPELMARVEMVWRANFGFSGPPPSAGGG